MQNNAFALRTVAFVDISMEFACGRFNFEFEINLLVINLG